MIETREQYDIIRANPTALLGDGVLGMHLIETIEALREVAKVIMQPKAYCAYPGYKKDDAYSRVVEAKELIDALPDWLLE